jgi:hypothetical protein
MQTREAVLLLLLLLLLGCRSPTGFSDARVEEFVAAEALPNALRPFYFAHLTRHDLHGFSVDFGDIVPCPFLPGAGKPDEGRSCRSGVAIGVRLGERVGWLRRELDGVPLPEDASSFDVLGPDDPIVAAALWTDFRTALGDSYASYYQIYLKERVLHDPDTPLAALHRIADELVDWLWPPAADLLLDHPVAGQDRTLVEKLASLPVFQGDPYAGPRARAQALLAATP